MMTLRRPGAGEQHIVGPRRDRGHHGKPDKGQQKIGIHDRVLSFGNLSCTLITLALEAARAKPRAASAFQVNIQQAMYPDALKSGGAGQPI